MKNVKYASLIIFFLMLIFNSCMTAIGQTHDYFKEELSPQVALINRFGTYPVDLSTGLVDISIPLHTIELTDVVIPIKLKFHASGLRSDEQEGLLGVRWALSGGAHVSRVIKGYPDEYYPFEQRIGNLGYTPDFNTLFGTTSLIPYDKTGTNICFEHPTRLDNGRYWEGGEYRDTEYDVFSFCLPSGRNGHFILKDVGGIKTACLMPYEPLKIYVMHEGGTGRAYNKVTIVDESGVTYCFGEERELPNSTTVRYVDKNSDNYVTTWHLSSIISSDKTDTIQFDYVHPDIAVNYWNESLVVSDQLHDNTAFGMFRDCDDAGCKMVPSPLYEMIGELLTNEFNYFSNNRGGRNQVRSPYVLSSIQYKSGGKQNQRIDFTYEQPNKNPKYLKEVSVKDGENNIVKRICFILKDNLSGNLKFLDKVEFTDIAASDNTINYQFDYYDSSSVPRCGDLAKNSDWWGYYSANAGWFYDENIALRLPSTGGYITRKIEGGLKQSDMYSMRIGMIKSIRYPTGGRTDFEYEGNIVGGQMFGGLRIKHIDNIPISGKTESRSYEYEGLVPDYLTPPLKNIFIENEMECYNSEFVSVEGIHQAGYGKYMQRNFLNCFPTRYSDYHSNIVYYTKVSEFLENRTEGTKQKTVFEYDVQKLDFSFYSVPNGEDFEGYETNGLRYKHGYVSPEDFWRRDKLRTKRIYDGSRMVKEIVYDYDTYMKDSVYDLPVYRYRLHNVINLSSAGITAETANCAKELSLIYPDRVYQTFAFKHQRYTSGADKLVKETEHTYYSDDTISITKEYEYDPKYLLLVSERFTGSDGEKMVTTYTYPHNCCKPDDNIYIEMVNKNILTPVLVKEQRYGDINWERVITSYDKLAKDVFYPSAVFQEDSRFSQKDSLIDYLNYTSQGRPAYLSKNNGTERVVYIWSYNHQYPVAVIQNATYDQVAKAIPGGNAYLALLADKISPTIADYNLLDNLRSALPDAFVTTATYLPLVGKLSVTDPSGLTTGYRYDSMGRLKETYILEKGVRKILQAYDYHYVN